MSHRKQFFCGVVLCLAAVFLLIYFFPLHGDVRHTEHIIGASQRYSASQIDAAFNTVEKYFIRNFSGCTLHSLRYDTRTEIGLAEQIAEQEAIYHQKAIVVRSNFTAGYISPVNRELGLTPGQCYEDWQWVLTCDDTGHWAVQAHGI